jgi:hypothetical protein
VVAAPVGRTTLNMSINIGELEALFLYPEKSVSGRLVDVANSGLART